MAQPPPQHGQAQPPAQAPQRSDCVLLSISVVRQTTIQQLVQELDSLPVKTHDVDRPLTSGHSLGSAELVVECWTNERSLYPNAQGQIDFTQVPLNTPFVVMFEWAPPRAGLHTVVGYRDGNGEFNFWEFQVVNQTTGQAAEVSHEVLNPASRKLAAFWWGPESQLIEDLDPDDF